MKRWIAIVMSIVPLVASAASFWDGSATLQRGDSSFEGGLFAASDSFAADTVIQVENLDTGRTVRVTVSEGTPGQPGILVLLSPKAAEALGIPAGSVARVRVTLAARAPSGLASLDRDMPTNPDPEIGPSAAPAAETPAEQPPAVQPPVEEPSAVQPAEIPPAETAPVEAPPAVESTVEVAQAPATPVEPVAVEPSTVETPASEDEQLLKDLAARTPQKQLFLPPREDEKFAYQQPVEPPQPEAGITAAEPLPAPTPALEQPIAALPSIESAETTPQPAAAAGPLAGLAEAQAPSDIRPEISDRVASSAEPQGRPPRLPLPEAEVKPEVLAALPPQSPAPQADTQAPAKTTPAPAAQKLAPSAQQLRPALPAGASTRFYVQLAAYAAEPLASGLAASLSATYPMVVLAPAATGGKIYRVLVGPLNKAESGTLLRWFRNRGFPDAFVKQE